MRRIAEGTLLALVVLVPHAPMESVHAFPTSRGALSAATQQETVHPVDAYRDRPEGIDVAVVARDDTAEDGTALRLTTTFDEAHLAGTIGTLDGPPPTLIGELVGVLIDDRDLVYFLDAAYKEIRAFTHEGRFLSAAGRSGSGPGEFREPRALGFAPGGEELLVGDLGRQFHRFHFVDAELRHVETERVEEFTPTAMCLVGDRLLLHGPVYQGDEAFHFLSAERTIERSFGAVYRSPHAMINYLLSEGRVACSAAGDMFAFAPSSVLGEARGYDADGVLRWITQIEPFRPVGLVDDGSGYRVTLPSEGFHRVESLTLVPPDRVLLQVGLAVPAPEEAGSRTPPEVAELHSYLLDIHTGTGAYLGDRLPMVVAMNERYAVTSMLVGERAPGGPAAPRS